MVVNTETRTAIWNAIHDAARWGRYYGTLAGRYRRREWIVRSVLLMSALGTLTALVSAMPEIVQRLVGGAVGVAIIIDVVFHPSQTAAVLARVRDECDQDRIALDELWRDLATIGEEEARRRFESLNRHLVFRHVIIFGRGHGLQRAIIDESQHRTPEHLIMAQH